MTYLLIMNFISFFLWGLDKYFAIRHKWRIPEIMLFLVSFMGGCFGFILGMVLFSHKTKKILFWVLEILFCFIWIGLIVLHFYYGIPLWNEKVYDVTDFGIQEVKSNHDENQNGIDDC